MPVAKQSVVEMLVPPVHASHARDTALQGGGGSGKDECTGSLTRTMRGIGSPCAWIDAVWIWGGSAPRLLASRLVCEHGAI